MGDDASIGEHYRRIRRRLAGLLEGIDDAGWDAPVAACPGWRVHDVLGHLVGICEDALAGTVTGPPSEEVTAAEVERHRDDTRADLLGRWAELAPPFEELITAVDAWSAAIDVCTHEHDVRTALDRPGARDDAIVQIAATFLVQRLDVDGTVIVDLGDRTLRSPDKPGSVYHLRTTAFEVFRFRMGRRTPEQVKALDWSLDPSPLMDDLFFFGPATAPLAE